MYLWDLHTYTHNPILSSKKRLPTSSPSASEFYPHRPQQGTRRSDCASPSFTQFLKAQSQEPVQPQFACRSELGNQLICQQSRLGWYLAISEDLCP